jgi:hypothetical protein
MAWWGWTPVGWVGVSVLAAPLIGMALHEADRRERQTLDHGPAPAVRSVRGRPIPVPTPAMALLLTGVALEAVGFVVRTSDHEHTTRLWSMDAPLSLSRMFVAGLLLAAAVAASAGAFRGAGRRPPAVVGRGRRDRRAHR